MRHEKWVLNDFGSVGCLAGVGYDAQIEGRIGQAVDGD